MSQCDVHSIVLERLQPVNVCYIIVTLLTKTYWEDPPFIILVPTLTPSIYKTSEDISSSGWR